MTGLRATPAWLAATLLYAASAVAMTWRPQIVLEWPLQMLVGLTAGNEVLAETSCCSWGWWRRSCWRGTCTA
ncbi:MAG: hypothetical protein R2878_01025 [Thermoleophilia bacterium]